MVANRMNAIPRGIQVRYRAIVTGRRKDKAHAEARAKKEARVAGLNDLLIAHEQSSNHDYDEIRSVKMRLRHAKQQLSAMGI